jgi:hypothetical protein
MGERGTQKGGGWRYQPVVMSDGAYLLCEVHVNADGSLRAWTDPGIYPSGYGDDALGELTGDICRMLLDAYAWHPVRNTDLRAGMRFARAITMEQRNALADFTQRIAHNTEQARATDAEPSAGHSDSTEAK